MAAFSAGGWYPGRALETRFRTFRVGVGNLHDPALGNMMSLDSGLLSFHVYFQAKRYKDSIPSSVIRDFRGAMSGRADKGLIITTGVFTRDAIQEAQRAGTIPIDLIDGNDLTEKLKELRIGVEVTQKLIEEVQIDEAWFKEI